MFRRTEHLKKKSRSPLAIMKTPRQTMLVTCGLAAACLLAAARLYSPDRELAQVAQEPSASGQSKADSGITALPRGKKLILRDGSFQIVRSYERKGGRVRYYSVERGAWEELPAAMVDWDATAKAEAEENRSAEELAKKVHIEEEQRRAEIPLDIDASLPVAPGVFLPPGEGMFLVEGHSVTPLEQVDTKLKTDKKQFLKQVLVPVPIVPGKRNLVIAGAKAKLRFQTTQPEFYLREAPPDPEHPSPVQKSSRPGESGPEVELVRAAVKGDKRQVGSISTFMGEQVGEKRNTISIQRWEIARNVFRFTLSQSLEPGEYVLAEILPEGMNLYVWDFGVDRSSAPGAAAKSTPSQKTPH